MPSRFQREIPPCQKLQVLALNRFEWAPYRKRTHFLYFKEDVTDQAGSVTGWADIYTEEMPPLFAHGLRGCPALHTIRSRHILTEDANADLFASVDAPEPHDNRTVGVIRSLRNGEKEVLHARLYLADGRIDSADWRDYESEAVWVDHAGAVDWRYVELEQPEWQHFSEYDGETVPLEIIEEMLAAEGLGLADWTGRGLEVGDRAWELLTDWMADDREEAEHRENSEDSEGSPSGEEAEGSEESEGGEDSTGYGDGGDSGNSEGVEDEI